VAATFATAIVTQWRFYVGDRWAQAPQICPAPNFFRVILA